MNWKGLIFIAVIVVAFLVVANNSQDTEVAPTTGTPAVTTPDQLITTPEAQPPTVQPSGPQTLFNLPKIGSNSRIPWSWAVIAVLVLAIAGWIVTIALTRELVHNIRIEKPTFVGGEAAGATIQATYRFVPTAEGVLHLISYRFNLDKVIEPISAKIRQSFNDIANKVDFGKAAVIMSVWCSSQTHQSLRLGSRGIRILGLAMLPLDFSTEMSNVLLLQIRAQQLAEATKRLCMSLGLPPTPENQLECLGQFSVYTGAENTSINMEPIADALRQAMNGFANIWTKSGATGEGGTE